MPTTAIVLSGGGSRGAFQLGALRFLYREHGVKPTVFCSTSVGSLHAAKLAEAKNDAEREDALATLEHIWGTLTDKSHMYVPTKWVQARPALKKLLVDNQTPADTYNAHMASSTFHTVVLNAVLASIRQIEDSLELITELPKFLTTQGSLYDLSPIKRLLTEYVGEEPIRKSGNKLRISVACLETGTLRYVTEDGKLLERNNSTFVTGGPPPARRADVAPGCLAQYDAYKKAQKQVRDAGTAFSLQPGPLAAEAYRDALMGVENARGAYDACAKNQPGKVPIIDAVLASAAMPALFPAVQLMGETYVDGGVLEVLPVRVAADLKADHIYCIGASAGAILPSGAKFDNVLAILGRTLSEMTINEIANNEFSLEVEAARLQQKMPVSQLRLSDKRLVPVERRLPPGFQPPPPPSVWAIDCRRDLYSPLEISQPLIKMLAAYGYMRASDVVNRVPYAKSTSAEQVIDVWIHAIGQKHQGTLVDAHLQDIRDAVQGRRREQLGLPADADDWATLD